MVLQEMSLIENLTVAENIFLGNLPGRFGMVDFAEINNRAAAILADLGLAGVSPQRLLATLQLGEQKLVEIARQLVGDCRLLILDEPTDILNRHETGILFGQIDRLIRHNIAIVFISHRLGEVSQLCRRATILRDGATQYSAPLAGISRDQMIARMVGRALDDDVALPSQATDQVAFEVRGLSSARGVKNISFSVAKGEILGLAGLMGSGRSELLHLLFGANPKTMGSVFIGGSSRSAKIRSPVDAIAQGIALVPKDRKTEGLLLDKSISDNMALASLNKLSRLGWVNRDAEREQCEKLCSDLSVAAESLCQPVAELSGGNQQKVLIGRWLLNGGCRVLLLDEPTRGVDVGAREGIYLLLSQLCASGVAVVLVSSDLRELMQLCDRIAVLSAGHWVSDFTRGQWSEQKIMAAAFSAYS